MRLRRSSKLMFYDPYTLLVALDSTQQATGRVYLDDETSLDHLRGAYSLRTLSFRAGVLSCAGSAGYGSTNTVERIVVVGLKVAISRVRVVSVDGQDADVALVFSFDETVGVLTVKKPDLRLTSDWSIVFE